MARGDVIYDMPKKLSNERQRLEDTVEEARVSPWDRDAIVRYDQHRDVEQGMKNSTRYADAKELRVAAELTDTPLVDITDADDVTPSSTA